MSPRRASVLRGEDAQDLRGHLIATAARLIGERGTGALTVRDIAREARVADGVLYNYFEDKEDLLANALLAHVAAVVGSAPPLLPEPGTGTAKCLAGVKGQPAGQRRAQKLAGDALDQREPGQRRGDGRGRIADERAEADADRGQRAVGSDTAEQGQPRIGGLIRAQAAGEQGPERELPSSPIVRTPAAGAPGSQPRSNAVLSCRRQGTWPHQALPGVSSRSAA